MIAFFYLLVALLGYLLGSLNSSIIVGKFYKIEIRDHGSKNAGMTNTLRTLGKVPALLVIFGDILKGVTSCILGNLVLFNFTNISGLGLLIGGFFAVLGHNWPVYFNFKGGKGILTTFAVILMMNYKIGLIVFLIFLIIVLFTKYISLGSIVGCLSFPIISYYFMDYFNTNIHFVFFSTMLSILAIARHHSNIKRLINGNENKLSFKKTG